MEIKGRITKAELSKREKKDGTGEYTMFELRVQIGTYERTVADYRTQTFNKVTEADEVCKTYFHDDARNAAETYHKGEVVIINMHHYVNQYGRTDTVVDSVSRLNDAIQAPAASAKNDDLPF